MLRNQLLDFKRANDEKRAALKAGRKKILDSDLQELRRTDPFEVMRETMQSTFGVDIVVSDFSDDYHSYINISVKPGSFKQSKSGKLVFKPQLKTNQRDLMVEGSGFLQWLSVYAIALDPAVNIILLDEPDAHLHCSLQDSLFSRLESICSALEKRAFIATHSTEILRKTDPDHIMCVDRKRVRYLTNTDQKVALISGLGSTFSPRIDQAKTLKRILFYEGKSDEAVLGAFARTLGRHSELNRWVFWQNSAENKERKQLFRGLREEIPDLICVSIRDRDEVPLGQVGPELQDRQNAKCPEGFTALRWRRANIEGYVALPVAVSSAMGVPVSEVEQILKTHGLVISEENFAAANSPEPILKTDFKVILASVASAASKGRPVISSIASNVPKSLISDDIKTFFDVLSQH